MIAVVTAPVTAPENGLVVNRASALAQRSSGQGFQSAGHDDHAQQENAQAAQRI